MSEELIERVKVLGDSPSPRFGHTLTMVSKTKAVLFGGAIGDAGKFIITNEAYSFDFSTKKWRQIEPNGQVPSQRAAHAATNIENLQMVVFGGAVSGGGGLSNDDLYLLDLRTNEEAPSWLIIPVSGETPGKRYGHTMVYNKPHLIVFGGNTGTVPINDVWVLNVEKAPYSWSKLAFNDGPSVRVYHSAGLCTTGPANGMMVVFGGRTMDQSALSDTWGLRRHRDGRWDWVQAPYKNNQNAPCVRYQHSVHFVGPLFFVIGGRTTQSEENTLPIDVYDTISSEWCRFSSINRYRHASFAIDNLLYLQGGFEPEAPNKPLDSFALFDTSKISITFPKLWKYFAKEGQSGSQQQPMGMQAQQQQQLMNMSMSNNSQVLQETFKANKSNLMPQPMQPSTAAKESKQNSITPLRSHQTKKSINKIIRLSNQAVVAVTYGPEEDITGLIKKIPLENLQEESKKLGVGFNDQTYISQSNSNEAFGDLFINSLLRPKDYKVSDGRFLVKRDAIHKLCDELIQILVEQPILLRLRCPLKIFGSLHGRYSDLMKLFDKFGTPHEQFGDIEKFDYLFLGNYVGRACNNLETICLLFSLKLKNPDSVFLLRGTNEDIKTSKIFGLGEECSSRLGEDINDPGSIFQKINKVFTYLPLAAEVEQKILCTHGGIGKSLTKIDQIDNIQRPLEMLDAGPYRNKQLVFDLIWSQYTQKENETTVTESKNRDIFSTGMVYNYGNTRLKRFLQDNNLGMIIRSHECIADGFERNSDASVISVFSCTDYAGKYGNSSAILKILKNYEILPYILAPAAGSSILSTPWLNLEGTKAGLLLDEEENRIRKRPATPPRAKSILKREGVTL